VPPTWAASDAAKFAGIMMAAARTLPWRCGNRAGAIFRISLLPRLRQDPRLTPDLWFAIPGDLATLTGGYAYDRRLLADLRARGLKVEHLPLPGRYPTPTPDDLAQADAALAALPDAAMVLIDGLAYGVLDAAATRQRERLRLIALCHHPLALETGLSPESAARLAASERAALQSARAVVVTSSNTAELLRTHFDLGMARILVALPGTDPQPFAPCTGSPPTLLTVATLTQRKAHDVLIAALAQLRDVPWRARFVGGARFDPAWSAALRAQVRAAGLEERIVFVGEKSDLAAEYQQADLFVLPSRFEGYGMVFSEALAAGLPIVATHAGAVPAVVPPEAGVLVPPNDSAALASALSQVLNDSALRHCLQRGARDAAMQLPRWDDTARLVATLLEEIRP
jgi:glycosyltransferase involved in cell wall biosynthesis